MRASERFGSGCLGWGLVIVLGGCPSDDEGSQATTDTDVGSTGTAGTDTGTGTDTDTEPQPAGPDHALDPSTYGPYPVGVRTIELQDPSRLDDMGQPRPLVVEIWYPATDAALDQGTVTYGLADVLRPEVYEEFGATGIEIALETEAVRDAEPRHSAGPYPLVLFSHGSSGVRMQSTYLTVPLASHGYVVVSADHYGNTLSDAIVAGGQTQEQLLQAFQDRPKDMDILLEHMSSLPGDDPLAGMVDAENLGVAGHSYGALTSVRWMGLGAPVDAVVAQAPPGMDLVWLAISDELADFDIPLMLHVGGLDTTTSPEDAASIWDAADAPRSRMTLATGGHFTFSDMCLIDRDALQAVAAAGVFNALDDGCSQANIDPLAAFPVLRHYAIGYFNLHLRGSTPTAELLTQDAGETLIDGDELTFEIEG